MTTTDDTTTVRLTGPRGLLAAVPALLGFHPQESLVMVCLSGPRRRVGPVIRVDLTDPADETGRQAPLIAQLQSHVRRYADEVALMCYTDRRTRPTLFYDLLDALEQEGTAILDAIEVRGGTAYPVGPEHGRPDASAASGYGVPDDDDPQVRAITAATAWSGRGVLPDRAAVHESIAGPTGAAATAASAALRAAADGLSGTGSATEPIDADRLARMARETIDGALAEVAGHQGLSIATSALIALLMCDVSIRDQLIARAVHDLASPWLPMLIAVARRIPDEDATQVCAALSVVAYRHGDGALAQVAVDRCLAADPDHRLAHLMLEVMALGLPPDDLSDMVADPPADGGANDPPADQ